MTSKKLYLKQNILAEPLFNQWYAWPLLIPPASAAMYICELASEDHAVICLRASSTHFRLEEPGDDWRPIYQLRF
jgi:hypothetical protein